jgi:sporulation protein YlmC with PRC-barrel domain
LSQPIYAWSADEGMNTSVIDAIGVISAKYNCATFDREIIKGRKIIMKKISYCFLIFALSIVFAVSVMAAEPLKTTAGQMGDQSLQGPQRASEIKGMSVKNPQGENLGKIDDLVIADDGTVKYVILSHGGLLGIGDKLIPIPWKALKPKEDKKYLTVNITKETLEKAPNFDPKEWPAFAEPEWQKKVQIYYELPSDQTAGR